MTLPALAPLPAHHTQHGSDPNLLGDELLDLIRRAIEYHPRSQQVVLGRFEIVHPPARYKMLGYDEYPGEPNWKATVGTRHPAPGTPIERRTCTWIVQNECERAGLRRVRLHYFRHGCDSVLLAWGASADGHGDPRALDDRDDHERVRPRVSR